MTHLTTQHYCKTSCLLGLVKHNQVIRYGTFPPLWWQPELAGRSHIILLLQTNGGSQESRFVLHLLHERERESCYDGEQYLLNICTFCLLLKKRNPTEHRSTLLLLPLLLRLTGPISAVLTPCHSLPSINACRHTTLVLQDLSVSWRACTCAALTLIG